MASWLAPKLHDLRKVGMESSGPSQKDISLWAMWATANVGSRKRGRTWDGCSINKIRHGIIWGDAGYFSKVQSSNKLHLRLTVFEVSVDRPILKSVLTEPMLAVLVILLLSTFFHSPSPLLRVWWIYRHIRLCVHIVARGQSVGMWFSSFTMWVFRV